MFSTNPRHARSEEETIRGQSQPQHSPSHSLRRPSSQCKQHSSRNQRAATMDKLQQQQHGLGPRSNRQRERLKELLSWLLRPTAIIMPRFASSEQHQHQSMPSNTNTTATTLQHHTMPSTQHHHHRRQDRCGHPNVGRHCGNAHSRSSVVLLVIPFVLLFCIHFTLCQQASSSLTISQRSLRQSSSSSLPSSLSSSSLDRPTKTLYIAGFFPTSRDIVQGAIGRGVLPAVKLALQHVNESPIFTKYKLDLAWNNTKVSYGPGQPEGKLDPHTLTR